MEDPVVEHSWKFWYPSWWIVVLDVAMIAIALAMTVHEWSRADGEVALRIIWPVIGASSLLGLFTLPFLRQRVDADGGGLSVTAGARRSRVGWDAITEVRPAPRGWRLQLRDGTEVALPAAFPVRLLEDWRRAPSR